MNVTAARVDTKRRKGCKSIRSWQLLRGNGRNFTLRAQPLLYSARIKHFFYIIVNSDLGFTVNVIIDLKNTLNFPEVLSTYLFSNPYMSE